MKEKIGFVGLGIMGKPMALHLLKAGYTVEVFARDKNVLRELADAGAGSVDSPTLLAAENDILIAMLPDSPQVLEVALGDNGLLHGLKPGKLFIDMSTIDPATELEIKHAFNAAGVQTLDAPVSGGEKGARESTLSIMVGGDKLDFDRALPVLRVLGNRITHMGSSGAGQITKSCNQIATALATQGVIEAFALAKKNGVDLARLREAMSGGFAASKSLEIAGDRMITKDFTPGFKMKLYHKDLRIASRSAEVHSLSLPGTRLLFNEMTECIADGKGELDFSALIQLFDK